MEPVGTIYQSAMADLKDVAIISVIKIENPQPFQKITNFALKIFHKMSFISERTMIIMVFFNFVLLGDIIIFLWN